MTRCARLLISLLLLAILVCSMAQVAAASTSQESILEDDVSLHTNLIGTLATLERLGVTRVKVEVEWASIAPASQSFHEPKQFDGATPLPIRRPTGPTTTISSTRRRRMVCRSASC